MQQYAFPLRGSVTALTQGSCAWGIYHEGICHIAGVATRGKPTSARNLLEDAP